MSLLIKELMNNRYSKDLIKRSLVYGDFKDDVKRGYDFFNLIDKLQGDKEAFKKFRGYFVKNNIKIKGSSISKRENRVKSISSLIEGRGIDNYLDIGCGDGLIGESIGDYLKCRVTGVDVVDYCKSNKINFTLYDGKDIKFSKKFDLITLLTVLHHVKRRDLQNFIKMIRDNLLDEGILIVREFNCENEVDKKFQLFMDKVLFSVYNNLEVQVTYNYFSKGRLEEVMCSNGFTLERVVDDISSDIEESKNPYKPFYMVFKKSNKV